MEMPFTLATERLMSGVTDQQIQKENRRHPRIEINRRVLIRLPNKSVVHMSAHNISAGGVQVRCDSLKAYLLHPSTDALDPSRLNEVEARLTLPVENGLQEISARCQLLYFTPLSNRLIAMGLEFIHIKGKGHSTLQRFVAIIFNRLPKKIPKGA